MLCLKLKSYRVHDGGWQGSLLDSSAKKFQDGVGQGSWAMLGWVSGAFVASFQGFWRIERTAPVCYTCHSLDVFGLPPGWTTSGGGRRSRRAFKFAERVSNIYSGFKSRWHNHCTLETIFVETTVLFDIFVQYVLKYISKSPGHGCLLTTGPGKKVPSSLKPLQNRSPAHRRKSPRSCCHKLQHGDPIVTAGPTGLEMFAGPRRTLRILQNTHIKANIKAKINTSKKKNNMKKQMASFVFCIFFGVSWFVCFFFCCVHCFVFLFRMFVSLF